MTKLSQIALTTVALLGISASTHAVLIDNFTASQFLRVDLNQPPNGQIWDSAETALTSGTDLVGASRDVWLAVNPVGTTNNRGATTDIDLGNWGQSNDTGVSSNILIIWDKFETAGTGTNPPGTGTGGAPTGVSGTWPNLVPAAYNQTHLTTPSNLTLGNANTFRFTVARKDASNFDFTLTVYEGAGSSNSYTTSTGTGEQTNFFFDIPFSNFGGAGNLDAVTKIELSIAAGVDADFEIDKFETVPEPTTLALLGLGLAGIGARARRLARKV
jgi:hypothetical protein